MTQSHEILIDGRINNHEHSMLYKVYFDDTDSGGIMYHTNYIKICERARTDCLHIAQITYADLKQSPDQPLFVVAGLEAKYKSPAILEDTLLIKTKIKHMRKSYILFEQLIYKLNAKIDDHENNTLLFSMDVKIAYINKNNKPTMIPQTLRDKLIF